VSKRDKVGVQQTYVLNMFFMKKEKQFHFYAPSKYSVQSFFIVSERNEKTARKRLAQSFGMGRCPNGTRLLEFTKM
jgi:hypothetical protein